MLARAPGPRTRSARRADDRRRRAATGKIVACQRGTNARVDKGFNVIAGGAAGMILYNPIKQDVETDNHWLPAIHSTARAPRCSTSSAATRA